MAPNIKVARVYKAMKAFGYSSQVVKPVLKTLLDLYDQNWELIEDEKYKVLLDAIIESQELKGEKKKPQRLNVSDEHLKDTSPGRRYTLRSHTLQISPSSSHSSLTFSDAATIPPASHGKQKLTDSNVLSPLKNHQKAENVNSENYYSNLELTERIELLPGENIDESDPRSADILLTDYSGSIVSEKVTDNAKWTSTVSKEEKNANYDSDLSKQKNDLEQCHAAATSETEKSPNDHSEFGVPLAVTFPDCSGPEFGSNSSKDYSFNAEGDGCSPGGHCLECKCMVSAEEKDHTLYPSQFDIASSSGGEVKISMIYKCSLGSNFSTPSLEAVSRLMEEDFLESYGLRQPGFSMTKFMKDVCECFLAAGTATTDNNRVRPGNFQSDLGTSKKFDPEDVLNGSENHEKGLSIASNISLAALKVLNLDKVVPQIPRTQGLNFLDFSHCKTDLPLTGAYGLALANPSPTSSSMMIVKKQIFSQDILSFSYHVEDITRGEEDLKVSLINEFSNERPNFKYIPRNISYRNAYVKFPLARVSDDNCCPHCSGNCLSSEIPCACASETGGDFAYTAEGLVKEKFLEDCILVNHSLQQKNLFYCEDCPLDRSKNKGLSGKCKGHMFRRFIKECWYKCGCGMKCGNRVVQRGIKVKLQVFMTPEGKGWGLRTLEDLPKGSFVCEYVGEVVTNTELHERNMRNTGEKHTYPVLLDADWGTEGVLKDEEALCLDATFYGNVARFINHRCYDANLVEIPVEVETPDHHYYHLAFFTTRKIDALEELTWDYGIDFDDDTHPVKAFQCSCGSQHCRDVRPLKRRRTK